MSILELVGPAEGGDGGHLLGAVLLVARVPAHAVVVAVAAPGAVDAVAVAALEPAVRTPADADNNSRVNINRAISSVTNTIIQIPASQGAKGTYTGWHWVSSLPSLQSMCPSHLEARGRQVGGFKHWNSVASQLRSSNISNMTNSVPNVKS